MSELAGATRNSEKAYLAGDTDLLSFEYRLCLERALPFGTAKEVEFLSCGYRLVVDHLLAQPNLRVGALTDYVKSIGCLVEGDSEATMNKLVQYIESSSV